MQDSDKIILAFVGMPGSGKSEVVSYLLEKGIQVIRFGKITDDGLKELGLPLTPENERNFRENIRKELGMAAYAIKAEEKINELLKENNFIAIDGLYSWEEYLFLKNKFSNLKLILIFASPQKRYERLSKREIRPIPLGKSAQRDIDELEKLNKGGPIAMANYIIENDSDSKQDLYKKIDSLLEKLEINI